MKEIPVHQLKERASLGLEIWRYDIGDVRSRRGILDAHRDDHYIFL